jgi:hypothetical protein
MHRPVDDAEFAAVQKRFADAVFSPPNQESSAHSDIQAGTLSAAKRVAIYRHNVYTTLKNALSDLFPAVRSIVGDGFFDEMAKSFITAEPSLCGDLNCFGETLPMFIGTYPHALELPYLADVALLEWRWHTAFHAADAQVLDFARLGEIPPERLGETVFELHPSVALLESQYPLFQIWQINQPGYDGDWAPDWDIDQELLVVNRQGFEVAVQQLDAAQFAMLSSMAVGKTLEASFMTAIEKNSSFDLQGFLAEFVQRHIIVNFRIST